MNIILYLRIELNSDSFLQKYLKAKHNLGTEKLRLLKVLFFGPPGAGKSTLLSVLLDQDVQSYRESTGVLDRKLVQFKVAVQTNVEKAISQWKIVKIEEEILRLRHIIEGKLDKHTLEPSNKVQPDLQTSLMIDNQLANINDELPVSENQHQVPSVQQRYKTSNTLMACYDSGGQPEFFDVMPAFISATTGNIMIFDMSKELHSNLDPEFFKKGKRWGSSEAKTHYTGAQLLKTALANIQSYATRFSSHSMVNSYFRSSRLLVVGTHLDQCGSTGEEVHERLYMVEKIVHDDVLHDCSAISVVKRPRGKSTKIIYPIASKCDKDDFQTINCRKIVAQEIRTAIESMSEQNTSNDIPISWLLFQYEIKLQSIPCILQSDCKMIAKNAI